MITNEQMTEAPTVLDLFCGCGGLSTGFIDAGYRVIGAIDHWNMAIETYRASHPDVPTWCQDICTLNPQDTVPACDVIIGGPPCQGFSMAGRRDTADPRNSLFTHFIRFVERIRPRLVVMENVRGILTMKTAAETLVKDIILAEYARIGYHVRHVILNAADYDVPQSRHRVFFIGTRSAVDITPPQVTTPQHIAVSTVLEPRDVIPAEQYLSQKALDGIVRKRAASRAKGHGFGAQILDMDKPSYTIPARYWKDGYDALVRYVDTDDHGETHERVRRLTVLELTRIQTFPDDYPFRGSRREIIMQIGNAVPCRLAYAIAAHLKSIISIQMPLKFPAACLETVESHRNRALLGSGKRRV